MYFMSSQSKSFTTDKKKIARLTHWQKEEKHTCEEALNSGDGELLVVEEEGQLAGEVEHRVMPSTLFLTPAANSNYLRCNDNDEDGGDNGAEELMAG